MVTLKVNRIRWNAGYLGGVAVVALVQRAQQALVVGALLRVRQHLADHAEHLRPARVRPALTVQHTA